MKISKVPLLFAILIPTSAFAQTTVVLIDEDFESGGGALNSGNSGARVNQVADPVAGGTNGTVAAVDIGGGGQWGEIRAIPQNIPLPAGSIAGSDTFSAKIDVYIDSANTTFIPGELQDRFNLILRFNDGVDDADRANQASNNGWETITPNQWNPITVSGTIPATDLAGDAITHVLPIISLRDENDNAVAGTAAYFDNFRIEATVPADDPNLAVIPSVDFGQVELGTGPVSQSVTIENTGASVPLQITAGDIVGTNPAQFSLVGASFPVTINPGESLPLEISFDPGLTVADFTAGLDLSSNDQKDPVVSVALSGSGVPVFSGSELIINGDFETGDLTDWRDDDRFDFTATPTHNGSGGAAVFNLAGGNQWGEARISGPSPPTTADDPQAIEITPEMIGKRYRYSAWYYRPATGGMAPDDIVSTIFRWNKNNTNNHVHGGTIVGEMPTDTWVQVTGEGFIPELGGDGLATTSVVPIWSFQDVGADAPGGEVMYIDDVSFQVEATPSPEPFLVGIEIDEANSRILVRWKAVPGATYAVDRSTALKPDTVFPGGWEEVNDGIIADSIDYIFPDAGGFSLGEDALFYRVRLLSLP